MAQISAQDLPELPAVYEQAANVVRARHVSLEDFMRLFDEEVHGRIRGAALAEGVTHLCSMENLDFWSSQFGHRTAMIVGEKQTFSLEKVLTTPYFRLGDTPSRFQYCTAYASVTGLKSQLPPQEAGGTVQT